MLLSGKLYKEEKQRLYDLQNGVCCICKRALANDVQSNHLDHDHALDGPQAGKVRGLLCALCNGTEGIMKHKFNRSGLKGQNIDYLVWLRALLEYLEKDNKDQNIHPQYVLDKAKKFASLGRDDMIKELKANGFVYLASDTKPKLVNAYKKQLRKTLNATTL